MPNIQSATFVLAVNDLDAAVQFYTEKLGFAETRRVPGWSFLSRGACTLRLGDCPDAKSMWQCQDHSWFAYLQVDNATQLFGEFGAQQVKIWHPLEDKPWGMREFAIITPDGHRIMFGEALP